MIKLLALMLALTFNPTVERTQGTFTQSTEEGYYQFKSTDNSVWWYVSAEEIGYKPIEGQGYVLYYDTQGTTEENKPCDCAEEYECECEVYDDTLIAVLPSKA